jgi:hypothetical protein
MSLSKKIRFEVFKRDGFKCVYCGRIPSEAVLEVDHVMAVSNGGTDDINNLITSCFDCNRGKSNIKLSTLPATVQENIEKLQNQEEQLTEYYKLLKKIRRQETKQISRVNEVFCLYHPGFSLSESFKNNSLKNFIKKLGPEAVVDAMHSAGSRGFDRDRMVKYFCGICWRKTRENEIE